MNWHLLGNSLLVAGLATTLAVALGFGAALGVATLGGRGRKAALGAAALALVLPPFLVTNAWLNLLGATGAWKPWFPFDIFSLAGAVWVLALMHWPVALFLVAARWERLEAGWLEAEPALAGWPLIGRLLWPLALPSVGLAAMLVLVLTLNQFSVPAILQVKVLPAEIWVAFNTNLQPLMAWLNGWPLMVLPLGLVLLLRRQAASWGTVMNAVPAGLLARRLRPAWHGFGLGALTFGILLGTLVPLVELGINRHTWMELGPALNAGFPALGHSLLLAAVTATATSAAGLLLWRWRGGVLFWVIFLTPGIFLGVLAIWIFNRPGLEVISRSFGIVFLCYSLRYLAPGWQIPALALGSFDRDQTDAARLEGANRWQIFRHLQLPQLFPQLAAGWYVVYLLCLWDVETLVLIQPPGGETLALRAFNLLHYGHSDQVNALCLILLCAALLPVAAWAILRQRRTTVRWLVLPVVMAGAASCSRLEPQTISQPVSSLLFERVEVVGRHGAGPGEFNKPRSLAVDREDNLFVVDITGRVQKFSPRGTYLLAWQMPQTELGKAKGMGRDPQGNILVVEPHYQRVNHYDGQGKLLAQWGVKGTNEGQFILPRAVAVSSRGDYFVSEYGVVERVQSFAGADHRLLRVWGGLGPETGHFNRAEGLGMDAQDQLHVADSCNHRIQVFTTNGQFLRAFGSAGGKAGELSYPYDVQMDAAGLEFVCEFGNSRIQVFDRRGRTVEIIGGPGAEPGRFNNPWAIAFDSQGNLYVADGGNHRVQKFIRKQGPAVGARART